MKHLLLGDEAIAQGAIDAGLSGVYAYPGTPSTEILIMYGNASSGEFIKTLSISDNFQYCGPVCRKRKRYTI